MSKIGTKWSTFLGTVSRALWTVSAKFLCQLLCLQLLSVGLFPRLRSEHYAGRVKGEIRELFCYENFVLIYISLRQKGDEKSTLQVLCSESTCAAINLLSPKIIVSIGRYTEDRINALYKSGGIRQDIAHKCMPHPSPRSLNNTNWNEKAKVWLVENDIMQYLQRPAAAV